MSRNPGLAGNGGRYPGPKPNQRGSSHDLKKHARSVQVQLGVQLLPAHVDMSTWTPEQFLCTSSSSASLPLPLHPPSLPQGLTVKASSVVPSVKPFLHKRSKMTVSAPLV